MKKHLQSIRMKLILTTSVVLITSFVVLLGLTSWQLLDRTQENVLSQAEGIAGELNNTVETFLDQYGRSIEQVASTTTAIEYVESSLEDGDAASPGELESLLEEYLGIYSDPSSIYVAADNGSLLISPFVDLPADFDATTRDWYINSAAAPDEVLWSEPYIDEATGEYVITASKGIQSGGQVIGVVGVDVKLGDLTTKLGEAQIGYGGFPFVLSSQGIALVHPTFEGESLMDYDFIQDVYSDEDGTGSIEYNLEGSEKLLVYSTSANTGWKVGVAFDQNDIAAESQSILLLLIAIGVGTLIVAAVIMSIVAGRFSKPIVRLNEAVRQVANGDLSVKSDVNSKDEIGDLSHQFNLMVDHMNDIISTVKTSVDEVRGSAEGLSAVAEETNASSEQVASAVSDIADGATQSAEEADEANRQSSRLSDQINTISEQSRQMSEVASEAGEVNQNGLNQMKQLKDYHESSSGFILSMESVIKDLEQKVQTIESVMSTITDISSQTNLLALNASIEAARAGEHGKGFAVVADEVRKLAEQSVRATDEVKQTIVDIQDSSKRAVSEMGRTKETFDSQSEVVEKTNEIFMRMSDFMSTMETSILAVYREIEDVSSSKEVVTRVIQEMAAMSEETAASCQQVAASTDEQVRAIQTVTESAERLSELSDDLLQAVNRFQLAEDKSELN
ncbi:methyl-accepting chemotaxis protein [Jeotgalibacillus sp. R-1-5s-1]|uniref:methyl-accepting chemotaxis protein n=1 Tax=Jeotgalibacillus sp. R-1-5s-1 TaxID=2555897 RepID=UPI00106BD890|nr:methyl-accepting chemotaxis protein [Jeotgalibacillus sp. R-1-5s-1]TFD96581.1 methyl-accepting chemotaxis protein [Jeotgalibacillus sp. R-1-5s-1]